MIDMSWLESSIGQNLIEQEGRYVRSALDSMFGDQFLQIGDWGAEQFRVFARTQRTAVVGEGVGRLVDVVTAADCLGIAADSIDVVLLPHVLETHDDPHGVLREVDRILRSDGHVIILGFNPVSLWGLRHILSRRGFPPGIQRVISEHRLRDWLRLLNYSVDHSSFQYFQAAMFRRTMTKGWQTPADPARLVAWPAKPDPANHAMARSKYRFIGAVRSSFTAATQTWRRHAPFAACYMLAARKELYTLTPIRPVWKRRVRLVGGLVNPTARNIS
jgi:SAM-dependent methyltransferase